MDTTYNLEGGFKPTVKRFADLAGPDFYPTPKWATHALIENEQFSGNIWECACGDGAMSEVLAETGLPIISSDLYDRGFGEHGHDFLRTKDRATNIITNPPYHSAQGFVEKALEQVEKKVAFLLRLAFLEGAKRANTIFSEIPPTKVWVFSERITFYPKGQKPTGSGTTAYAWFVWDKSKIGSTELYWLQPGLRARFS
ncbi:MAG: hypothetical protein IH995_06165 [Proteobacteria bacterium]|nr:hypothetical protein [Pseudomonadota bacterium]